MIFKVIIKEDSKSKHAQLMFEAQVMKKLQGGSSNITNIDYIILIL